MSREGSPAIERPYIPLRGRSKHIPTKRNFTFPATWKSNKDLSVEKYAKISETESGRGKVIEPASGAFLARHVHESPVPLVISNTEKEEEEEVYDRDEAEEDSSERSSQDSGTKRPTTHISGRVTLGKDGGLLLTPSPQSRKRKRNSVKTFESYEAPIPPQSKRKYIKRDFRHKVPELEHSAADEPPTEESHRNVSPLEHNGTQRLIRSSPRSTRKSTKRGPLQRKIQEAEHNKVDEPPTEDIPQTPSASEHERTQRITRSSPQIKRKSIKQNSILVKGDHDPQPSEPPDEVDSSRSPSQSVPERKRNMTHVPPQSKKKPTKRGPSQPDINDHQHEIHDPSSDTEDSPSPTLSGSRRTRRTTRLPQQNMSRSLEGDSLRLVSHDTGNDNKDHLPDVETSTSTNPSPTRSTRSTARPVPQNRSKSVKSNSLKPVVQEAQNEETETENQAPEVGSSPSALPYESHGIHHEKRGSKLKHMSKNRGSLQPKGQDPQNDEMGEASSEVETSPLSPPLLPRGRQRLTRSTVHYSSPNKSSAKTPPLVKSSASNRKETHCTSSPDRLSHGSPDAVEHSRTSKVSAPVRGTRSSQRKKKDSEAESDTSSPPIKKKSKPQLKQQKHAQDMEDKFVNNKKSRISVILSPVSTSSPRQTRTALSRVSKGSVDGDLVNHQKSISESGSDASPSTNRKRQTASKRLRNHGGDEISIENIEGERRSNRKSPRKSMSKSRVAKSPRHSALIEEEYDSEGVVEIPKVKLGSKMTKLRQKARLSRGGLINGYRESDDEESIKNNYMQEASATQTHLFDDHIEGGHFAQGGDKSLSLTSRSIRVTRFDSFNVSQPDHRLQRHSTPIPGKGRLMKAKSSLQTSKSKALKFPLEPELQHASSEAEREPAEAEPANQEPSRPEPAEEEPVENVPDPDEPDSGPSELGRRPEPEALNDRSLKGRDGMCNTPTYTPSAKAARRRSLFPAKTTQNERDVSTRAKKDKAPSSRRGKKTAPKSPKKQTRKSLAKENNKSIVSYTSAPGTSFQVDTPTVTLQNKEKVVIPEPETSMAEQPADVRIWQDHESKRTISDINDLDVILERIEERAWDIRESMMDPFSRAVIGKFMGKVQRDIRDAIAESHRVTRLTSCVTKLGSQIRKKRILLLECQQAKAKLNAEIAELKKKEASPMRCSKSMKEISVFLNDLAKLKEECENIPGKSTSNVSVVYGGDDFRDESPSQGVRRSLQFYKS